MVDIPSKNIFLSGGGEGWIVSWDRTGEHLDGSLIAKSDSPIFALAYDHEVKLVIAGSMNGDVIWLNIDTKSIVKKHNLSKHSIFDILIDGDNMYTVNGEGYITQWDILRMKPIISVPVSLQSIRSIIRLSTELLAVGASDSNIYILDRETLKTVQVVQNAHEPSVFSLALINEDQVLLSCGRDAKIKAWNISDYTLAKKIDAHLFTTNTIIPIGQNHFASASRDKSIRIWEKETYTLRHSIKAGKQAHMNSVNALIYLPEYTSIISASDDQTMLRLKIN